MRKTIVSLTCTCILLISAAVYAAKPPCTISKHRDKWRVGYNKVDQLTDMSDDLCTVRLECMEAGWQRCRVRSVNVYEQYEDSNGKPMQAEDEDRIDLLVNEYIGLGEHSGKFVFADMALVVWQYDPQTETIYTEIHNREMSKKRFNISF